jgi:chromosome condensin MukBEF complex kleisin-like MukF subunit
MSITNRGFAFSLDTAFSSLLIFAMLFLAISYFSAESESAFESVNEFGLWKNTLFVADSLVKNHSENKILGAAVFNEETRRVMENELDLKNVQAITGIESNEFFVKEVSITLKSGGKETVRVDKKSAGSCISIKRVVTVENEIGLLEVVACELQGN